jgi:hypothetical protein
MKSERRHELQTNALADWLGREASVVAPYVKRVALGAVVAVLGAWAIYEYFQWQGRSQSAAWNALANASYESDRSAELKKVVEEYDDTFASLAAQRQLVESLKRSALDRIFTDPAGAKTSLNEASDILATILTRTDDPLIRQWALFESARTRESLAKDTLSGNQALDQLKEAERLYRQTATEYKDGPYGKLAKERLDKLTDPKTREWYAWYITAKIETTSNEPAAKPAKDLTNLDDEPGIAIPVPSSGKVDIDKLIDALPGALRGETPPEPQPPTDADLSPEPSETPAPSEPMPPSEPAEPSEPTEPAPPAEDAPMTEEAPMSEDSPMTEDAPTASDPPADEQPESSDPPGENG